jgi:ABC-2 type transport system ATP-binding protein
VREVVRAQAARGRAVLISSHLLAEVAQSVDDVVVIAGGRLRAAGGLDAVLGGGEGATFVRTDAVAELEVALERSGARVRGGCDGALVVPGLSPREVGAVAAAHGVALVELRPERRSLEDAFLALTEVPA